ncbi:hypothetical protein T484DRAFT_1862963 [Baffinella frigidus]|nr:hypothetical protein T484DRAFT_1862963 [Cryptophyta sp. CCMP2293]
MTEAGASGGQRFVLTSDLAWPEGIDDGLPCFGYLDQTSCRGQGSKCAQYTGQWAPPGAKCAQYTGQWAPPGLRATV